MQGKMTTHDFVWEDFVNVAQLKYAEADQNFAMSLVPAVYLIPACPIR